MTEESIEPIANELPHWVGSSYVFRIPFVPHVVSGTMLVPEVFSANKADVRYSVIEFTVLFEYQHDSDSTTEPSGRISVLKLSDDVLESVAPEYVAPNVLVHTSPYSLVALYAAKSCVGSYVGLVVRKKLRVAGAAPVVKLPIAIEVMSVARAFMPDPMETFFMYVTA